MFLLTNAVFHLKHARSISTAAAIHKSTDIKTKPDEVPTCCICIQGQTNLRYIIYNVAMLVHSQILKLENPKQNNFKNTVETKEMPSFNLWHELPLCSEPLKYSPNCALDQQDCRNPLSFRSLVKDKGSVENPQDVHTRKAKVHSPVESIRHS